MKMSLGTILRTARKARGLVMKQVAQSASVSISAVGQWERDENEMTMGNLQVVCAFLGIDPVAASIGELRYLDEAEEPGNVEIISDVGRPDLGPKDVPILGLAVGGDDADFTFNGEIADYARRPPGIANLKNVFALHVLGVSMIPRFEPGEMLYAGGRPPIPGEDVVIEMFATEHSPSGKGYLKRLVRRTASRITVLQFNPERELDFDPYEIKGIHRVIPWREVLGF